MPQRITVISIVAILIGIGMWRSINSSADQAAVSMATYSQSIMASTVTVVAPEHRAAEAAEVVFEIFREIDAYMSEWKPDSPLTAVNNEAGGHPVEVPADLLRVVQRGLEIGALTDGAFDITWAALWDLWDFQAADPSVPEESDVARRVKLVDYREVLVDETKGTVLLPQPGMLIGLGGIAKGTALNRATAALTERGIEDFLISAGGQVAAHGTRNGRPWRIGIRDPRGAAEDYFASINVLDSCVATSGDYERYFDLDGVRYHHILDPRTGMPARGLRSATIVTADAELADALSTAAMILGADEALRLVGSLPGVEALLVDSVGEVHMTDGIRRLLRFDSHTT